MLPIYTKTVIDMYRGKRKTEMPPHVFAVADNAYHDMLQGLYCMGVGGVHLVLTCKKRGYRGTQSFGRVSLGCKKEIQLFGEGIFR